MYNMWTLVSTLRVLQRRLLQAGIKSPEAFIELHINEPTFITELFTSGEFRAEVEVERAAIEARSAAESEADLEEATLRAEVDAARAAIAAEAARRDQAEAAAARAETEMLAARAETKMLAAKATAANRVVTSTHAVGSQAVTSACEASSTTDALITVQDKACMATFSSSGARLVSKDAQASVRTQSKLVQTRSAITATRDLGTTTNGLISTTEASTCHYLMAGVGLLEVGIQTDDLAMDASSEYDELRGMLDHAMVLAQAAQQREDEAKQHASELKAALEHERAALVDILGLSQQAHASMRGRGRRGRGAMCAPPTPLAHAAAPSASDSSDDGEGIQIFDS